jgi:malonyl-CoA O-methyltransferase
MAKEDFPSLDARTVRRQFERAATRYDDFAFLQRDVEQRLIARLQYLKLAPGCIVDLGAGTGAAGPLLEARFPKAKLILVDHSPAMLQQAARRRRRWFSRTTLLCADAARTGLADASVDMIHSNLLLHWLEDLPGTLAECRRILKPGGLLLFSTVGPETLMELRRAWAGVDDHPHVHVFLDMHDVGDAVIRAGFAAPVMERENLTVTYRATEDLLRDLRATGARNAHAGRTRTLHGRSHKQALLSALEAARRDGVLSVSYEIVAGHAWAPTVGARPQDGSTVAAFPLNQLKRRTF